MLETSDLYPGLLQQTRSRRAQPRVACHSLGSVCALVILSDAQRLMRLQVMGPQIAQLRPAVLEADPSGIFAQKYLYDLLGL